MPGSVVPLEEEVVDSGPTNFTQHRREMSVAFRELDACELRPLFECRAHVVKTVPFFLRGGFRAALRVALEEISTGQERGDEQKQERGWKLFFLFPRMLDGLSQGESWKPVRDVLLRTMAVVDRRQYGRFQQAASARIRKRRRQINNSQVARAENLAMIGELSAARQALGLNRLAPGNKNTLNELRNRERRPPTARELLPPEVASRVPERPFDLDEEVFCRNLRSARRGAAPGPSGMTCEHLQPILESDRDTGLLSHVATLVARGCVPPMALQVLRMGRLTALKKPQGGVRGIVVSDVFRRVTARTIAKQCAVAEEKATAPSQHALRTLAGCECVSHVLQTLTDLDPTTTILSLTEWEHSTSSHTMPC